ncbi:S8 family serine peptidase [Campylobacter lanienae]|uniref:S8 family serine peptidase n=2 Tax=Campylobacter TaxID=194 RepID=A0ABY3G8Z8_9BACT|nr:S8 family serine peptidase [Campylobacter lanienae]TWO28895.1 S8 family serine peptidase [Campylobacter lanienae]
MKSIKLSLILPMYLFGLTDFELINYNDKSVTGDGVFVGVIDSAINKDHPNLSGQIVDQIYSNYGNSVYTPNFLVDTHGSHVAGIILAKPDGQIGGIATDAKAYGVQITGHNTDGSSSFTAPDVYEYFKDKNIAAINNSWNATVYPLSGLNSLTSSSPLFIQYANKPEQFLPSIQKDTVANDLIKLSKEKKILSVFASGNEGIISPGIMALAPYYDEEIRSIIVVTALDSSQISKNSDGKFVMTTYDNGNYVSAPTTYSNGLKGVYNFSLAAPGTNINSVNASYNVYDDIFNRLDKNQYRVSSGTSMAAPVVTGAAALVAQKFPFMSGKQIADTLLSTANKDYIAPKIIVKETVTGTTICDDGNACPRKNKYTVFYIDSKIPRKEDGSIDQDAVSKDLINSWHFESGWKYDRMSNMKLIDDDDYPWVQEVTKEDLFGQGILDIDKALKGIGILDANRLSDADVSSQYGETAVYYSLDTKGNNTEFSNDISQRKWEADTHNPEAYNLPKNLDNLNVGLIKSGSGVLTLSGANSYEGATVIDDGGIRLLSKDGKTAQIAGSVYVNNGSILSGNGVIKQNLTNDNSIIRPGNEDLSDLVVDGTYSQTGQNSKLILDFGNDDNSQLIAKDYSISGGNLEYNPLAQYYTVDKEIKITLGDLSNHINNFNQIYIASNNSISFEMKLDSDKTTINKDPISIPPIHETEVPNPAPSDPNSNNQNTTNNNNQQNNNTQDPSNNNNQNNNSQSSNSQGSTTTPTPTPSNPESSNQTPNNQNSNQTPNPAPSDPNSNNQNTTNNNNQQNNNTQDPSNNNNQNNNSQSSNSQGSTTTPTPTPSNPESSNQTPNNQNSNQTPNPAPSDPNSNNQNTTNNNNQQNNNTQDPSNNNSQNNNIIITPVVRPDAYQTGSETLSQTMRNIRKEANLDDKYKNFFAALDQSDSNTYQETMSRIEGNSVSNLTSITTSNHTSFYQNNLLFSINPVNSTLFAYGSNPYDNGIFVASVASDYVIDLGFDALKPKNYWYINPTYKRYNGDGFDGYQSGISINLAHDLDNATVSYGIGASRSSLDFDIGAKSKSETMSLAANYTYDFGSFKLLSGGSVLVAFNENERYLEGDIKGKYKSYNANFELGLAKDYLIGDFVLSPLGYFSYGYIYQDSFRESGEIFAKNYDSINHDTITAALGLNSSYKVSDNLRYTGFVLYERMLNGYDMDAQAEFNDFKGEKFTQRYHLDKNRLNIGLGSEYTTNSGYFFKFGVGGEFATTSDNLNISATIGKRF